MSKVQLFVGDLPKKIQFDKSVAIDTETMGLNLHRDRLCLVQLCDAKGNVYLVQIKKGVKCPNLTALLTNKKILKIFHFARFDVAKIKNDLGVVVEPVYCTKIASKLCRTSSPSHSLKALCNDVRGRQLCKEQQTSDWGAEKLSEEQQQYAAGDVLYLHEIKKHLDGLLKREGRMKLAQDCFAFLPVRAELDLLDFDEPDIFKH